uniref:Uncharacterized protein n=1 Tax=Rhizophora mucronata TaxID=61149 RepID=A0A2P2QMN5_RHIMU
MSIQAQKFALILWANLRNLTLFVHGKWFAHPTHNFDFSSNIFMLWYINGPYDGRLLDMS